MIQVDIQPPAGQAPIQDRFRFLQSENIEGYFSVYDPVGERRATYDDLRPMAEFYWPSLSDAEVWQWIARESQRISKALTP